MVIWIYPNTDYDIVLKPLLSDRSRDTSFYVPKIIDFSLSYLYENVNKRNKAYYSSDGILTTYNFSSMNSLNDNPSFYTSPGTRIVSLDYYQDINTIIEKLTNAIITLGGNV